MTYLVYNVSMKHNFFNHFLQFHDEQNAYEWKKFVTLIVVFYIVLPTVYAIIYMLVDYNVFPQDISKRLVAFYSVVQFIASSLIFVLYFFMRIPIHYTRNAIFHLISYNFVISIIQIIVALIGLPVIEEVSTSIQLIVRIVFVYLYWIRNDNYRQSTRSIVRTQKGLLVILAYVVIGMVLILVLNILSKYINTLIYGGVNADSINQSSIVSSLRKGSWFLKVFLLFEIIIVAPIFEEVIIRKGIFELYENKIVGYLLCAFYFALIHVQRDLASIFQYLFTSLVLSSSLLLFRNAIPGVALHSVSNTFSVVGILI